MKELREVHKFLGTCLKHEDRDGYTFNQQAAFKTLLEHHGIANANGVHRPISDINYEVDCDKNCLLDQAMNGKGFIVRIFQSLVVAYF